MATLTSSPAHRHTPQPRHPRLLSATSGRRQAQEGRPDHLPAQAPRHPQRHGQDAHQVRSRTRSRLTRKTVTQGPVRVRLAQCRQAAQSAIRRLGVRHPRALRFHVEHHAAETTQTTSRRRRACRHPPAARPDHHSRVSDTLGRGATQTRLGGHRRRCVAQTPSPDRRRDVPVHAACRITERANRQPRSCAPARVRPPAITAALWSALRDRQIPDTGRGAPAQDYRPGMLAQPRNNSL